MANFGQIQRVEHLPTRISLTIGQEIASGSLKAGDKLPAEHELAKTFGVSRSVVREAIAQLRSEGLIDTRQGVGAFVLEAQSRSVLRIESAELVHPESFRSLFQLHVPLEVEAAGLAAQHHTSADLARLDEEMEIMLGMQTRWTDEGVAADLAFHRAVAQATHNAYYSMLVGFIGEKITHTITASRARLGMEQAVQITLSEHTAVRNAIAARDVLRARTAMRTHILGAAARLGQPLEIADGDDVASPLSSGEKNVSAPSPK